MKNLIEKYIDTGSFVFNKNDELKNVCSAPKDKSGIYLIYDLSKSRELIYVGCSGHIKNDGAISNRKTGGGGIYGRLVNGHQFGKIKRYKSIPSQMVKEDIKELEFIWFVTFNDKIKHSPIYTESTILQYYFKTYDKLPRWNQKF